MVTDATTRFTDRVDDYVRWRPGYPAELVSVVQEVTGCVPPASIADVGSGTGISTHLWLDAGYHVTGVEPNAEMRRAAELQFAANPQFRSQSGTAEATGLASASVDLIFAAQAFHWFDRPRTRREFARILRPGGWVALVWNSRRLAGTPFLSGYEQLLLEFGTDYASVRHERIDTAALAEFFGGPWITRTFTNHQALNREAMLGRLRSTSYAPGVTHPRHAAMLAAAGTLFETHAVEGVVMLEYDVQCYLGNCQRNQSSDCLLVHR